MQALLRLCFLIFAASFCVSAHASPEQDLAKYRDYYQKLFPNLKLNDYSNGIYAIDPVARQSWQAIEEFPPYETAIDTGKVLFETPFRNGKHYADCFPSHDKGMANVYPKWDRDKAKVITLSQAINDCRSQNKEPAMPFDTADMVNLLAYLAFTTRGKPISVSVPANDARALAAYEAGKSFYFQRRGKLNFACATCHIQNAGKRLRAELLSPLIGHTNNWPTYRLKWGNMGTLHRRFAECLTQIKATPLPEQHPDFVNLEYFLTFMGNGVPISGPSTRK